MAFLIDRLSIDYRLSQHQRPLDHREECKFAPILRQPILKSKKDGLVNENEHSEHLRLCD